MWIASFLSKYFSPHGINALFTSYGVYVNIYNAIYSVYVNYKQACCKRSAGMKLSL